MAAEVSADLNMNLNIIDDEDVLRRMWQQTDDFGRKKEIRQRMYKLREQRLREFYTGEEEMPGRKHAASTQHADSIADQGFLSLKSKEVRDSESPTREIYRRQGDNQWNTVQQSTYSSQGGEGDLRESYERSSTGEHRSEDGSSSTRLEADERGFTSSRTQDTAADTTVSDRQQHDAQLAVSSTSRTDGGEAREYSTSQDHQESSSSVTRSKDSSSVAKSSSWSTSSSSSTRKVISSSNYARITDGDVQAITSGDDVDFASDTVRRAQDTSTSRDSKYETNESRFSADTRAKTFIDTETRNNIRNLADTRLDMREDHFDRDSRRDSSSTYTSEITSNVEDYVKDSSAKVTEKTEGNVVVDQNIMSEIHKLDTFLSTQNTPGTQTPASPRSVMGDVNWTVVSNADGEFVYRDDKQLSPGARSTPVKHPDNLDLPREATEGQYVTTYNEHYTSKRISVDVSPTHDKFARSLRQTPPGTPRSLSRQSLDRSSPERKSRSSPRSSPEKERRISTGSYTMDTQASQARRKTSEVTRQTGTSKDSSLKTKRKFSTTQNKAAAKTRSSTPGTSPSTSPSRKQKERSDTSSDSDSDASQITYDKKSTTSTYTRTSVRRNLMDDFDKESPTKGTGSSETITISKNSSRPSSPDKSPSRKGSMTDKTGILRKESRTDSKSTVYSVTENKIPAGLAPHVREKSPEYSSEGSVGKEVRQSQRKSSPDSSPERAAFTPIKQFRTSPEVNSETIQVTTAEAEQTSRKQTRQFLAQEALDTQKRTEDVIQVDVKVSNKPSSPNKTDGSPKRSSSPTKASPDRSSLHYESKPRSTPQKTRSPSPGKQTKDYSHTTRKDSRSNPQKTRSPSPEKQTKDYSHTTRKDSVSIKTSTRRETSPQKENIPRSHSPTIASNVRRTSVPKRSPSPQKEQARPESPTKRISQARKSSVQGRSPSPTKPRSPSPKSGKSRTPSPSKKEYKTTTTTTTVVRRSSLKKEPSFNASPRKRTPSPVKDKSRSPSPKKESPDRKSPVSKKIKSPSPQRGSNKRTRQQLSSPSVSPCSSPERQSGSKPVRKSSGPKTSTSETPRSTRRSSIPRSDQATNVVRKTVETKIEIRSKPISKIPSSTTKSKPAQSILQRNVRTDSQNSIDRNTTRTYSTTIKRTVDKPKEPVKKTPVTKKVVTTIATISLQKPAVTNQTKQTTKSTVSRAATYKRTPSKELAPKKADQPADKKPMVTTTTKRVASRTNTPKSKPATNHDETDRSSVMSSPEPVLTSKERAEAFIEYLRREEQTVQGLKDETINIEIVGSLENETRPELFPETEDDEELERQNVPEEASHHVTEKTINVDSKRKVAAQFVLTIKKPTATTPKAASKPVTARSSSGPVRGSPAQTPSKPMPSKSSSTNKKQTTVTMQKADSVKLIRTSSDKNVTKTTTQKRQLSKPEMTSKPSHQTTKSFSTKQVTETGIASRNSTPAKSATIKRVVPTKKRPTGSVSSSSSEDEEENIPSVVTPNKQEQEYIEELEEMRRAEEMEYAAKLTATSNQENQLLSVIVQHPKSSRESSPGFSNHSQPFCAVSDDRGSNPRFADFISEPEDVEVFDKSTFQGYTNKRFEQVTDLDEESEADEKLNVSVADRVSLFLDASKAHTATPVKEETEIQVSTENKNVSKAKAMFEGIARGQTSVPAPDNKPVDILSRPSIFEARKGQITPKPVSIETQPRTTSPVHVQRRGSVQQEYHQQERMEASETRQYEETYSADVVESSPQQPDEPRKVTHEPSKKPESNRPAPTVNNVARPTTLVKQPEQAPKTDPTSRPVKTEPTSVADKKRPDPTSKPKPFEKTISATAEISSKRAFFERKAQDQSTEIKTTKPYTPRERKPLTDSIQNKENIRGSSPPKKTSQTTTFIENERKTSKVERKTSRPSPERKISRASPERKPSPPAKERKHSYKSESPERKISLSKSVKERRSSFTKEDIILQTATLQKRDSSSKIIVDRKTSPSRESPERRAPITEKNFPDHKSSSVRDAPEQKTPKSPVKDRKPSFPRESPERSPQRKPSRSSPERSAKSPEGAEPSEPTKSGKFGVTLRRTSSTTSAGTPRRTSIPGESQEIEDVTDVSLLEIMMEKAVGYEQRRRIRAQIKVAKKIQDDKNRGIKQKSPTRSPAREHKVSHEPKTPEKKAERRPSSPTKPLQAAAEPRSTKRSAETRAEPAERPTSPAKRSSPVTNGHLSPERPSSPAKRSGGRAEPAERPSSPNKRSSPMTNGHLSPERRSPRLQSPVNDGARRTSKTETVEITTTVRSQTRTEEKGVDCITSSYGVGPTDELGRPLFGLRALRRTNTNKQLSDEVVSQTQVEREPELLETSRGRPLFGGLKALRQRVIEDEMPEQASTQLRELVTRHEQVVKETNGPQDQPKVKPKARLRDSFILQEEEQSGLSSLHLAEHNNLNRGLSLKSLIQKHENISSTGGVRSEVESSHTVVSSRSTVNSDGTVSLSRDVIQGELSAKNGEQPVGKVTRTKYTFDKKPAEDKGVENVTTTTTTLGERRPSGPQITEIEDAPQRKSSLKSTKRSSVEDTAQKITNATRTKTSSPTLTRQKSSEEETEEKRKVTRGDSVRALQHKFQQATENGANNAARSHAPRAGLILRTSSFTSAGIADPVSSTLKQSTSVSADKRNGRHSPEKDKRQSPVPASEASVRRESIGKTSSERRESLSKTSSETSRRESLTKTSSETTSTNTSRVTDSSSFLDNRTQVTGVQDILNRMRNADLVNESGDTDADREARALLNKFLGASVILQGMEAGLRAEGTPSSTQLVSNVERQRIATTRQKEEDIENIWDEQVLKNLLEQCTDYEGRRKLRARLRTVMAEHKACADLVALTGDSVANSHSAAETETKQVTMKTEGGSVTRTEVHTKTSSNRLTKASSVTSPFAKFRQLERQNSAPSGGQATATPLFKITDPRVARSASSIKDRLLSWVQAQTREYKNIQIDNFSTSWNNGLAFCALIHHFCPDAFDYDKLTPEKRRHNFELAFRVAEEAGIAPLLDVEDMVVMRRPDWKCVFTYVQSVYRHYHSTPEAVRC